MKLICYGINNRPHVSKLQERFINSVKKTDSISFWQEMHRSDLCPAFLGKNWSGFIFESDKGENFLMLLDCDDGGWQTPDNLKLNFKNLREVLLKYRIKDIIVFKLQLLERSERTKFLPIDCDNVFPVGLMTNDPENFSLKASSLIKKYENTPRDIDVFFAGGRVFDENVEKNYNSKMSKWPKDQPRDMWFSLVRQRGYGKLLEIKDRRNDLNIVCEDYRINNQERYFDLVMRSKICLGFPGIGKASRKFHEFLMLGKCAMSLKQQLSFWNPVEDVHYLSLGYDYSFSGLEVKIDDALSGNLSISDIEKNCLAISGKINHSHAIQYITSKINNHFSDSHQRSKMISQILDVDIDKRWERIKADSVDVAQR